MDIRTGDGSDGGSGGSGGGRDGRTAAAAAGAATTREPAATSAEIAVAAAPVAELVVTPGPVGGASAVAGTESKYVCTYGGGDGSDRSLSELIQTGSESGDLFSAAAVVTFEATAPAEAAEATVESVVATAEAPADAAGEVIIRTTGQLHQITTEAAELLDM
jgi:hypothetical protein